jgi:hypothetical protein
MSKRTLKHTHACSRSYQNRSLWCPTNTDCVFDGCNAQVTPVGEAISAEFADFTGLMPGMPYVFRLVCTNPAGTVKGKVSAKILTPPAPPPVRVSIALVVCRLSQSAQA